MPPTRRPPVRPPNRAPGIVLDRAHADLGTGLSSEQFGTAGSIPAQQANGTLNALEDGIVALLRRFSQFVPPIQSTEFRRSQEVDTAIVESVQFTERFQVPSDHEGICIFFQGMATNADATIAGSSFGLFIDEAPVPGYEAMPIFQAGGAQSIQENTWIQLNGDQTISVRFNHVLANPHHVGFIVKGFYWPRGSSERA